MNSFQFNVGTKNLLGTLNWSTNGTLGSLAVVDGFSSLNTQTCVFSYDDVARLVADNCGSVWSQTYQYDQYDNLNQFGNQPWTAPYYAGNNHYNLTGTSYDASGNLTSDAANTYTYDANNKLVSAVPIGMTCSNTTDGGCYRYDAFGNAVELNDSKGYYPMVYGQAGKTALMSGQTLQYAYIPTPGGGSAVGWPTGMRYTHTDWLGTGRVSSYIPASGNGTIYYDRSFAPYGQMYGNNGPGGLYGQTFAGDTGDLDFGLFDTPNRELAQNQGRWTTPDPAHHGWNLYAYPTDPNTSTDPTGLAIWPGEGYLLHQMGFANASSCTMDGVDANCSEVYALLNSPAPGAVWCPNNDCGAQYIRGQWRHFGAWADGSSGYMPMSLAGFSTRDAANALAIVTTAKSKLGTPVDPSKLTGRGAEAYNILTKTMGVDPQDITIYQNDGGDFAAVLSRQGFDALMDSGEIQFHPGDAFLHYPYANGTRDMQENGSLHGVWLDPNLTDYVGGSGVYMQFHTDKNNPWEGGIQSWWDHMKCVFTPGC